MTQMKWRDAIVKVLSEAGEAMHYADIAEQISLQKLRTKLGATPANSVSTAINISIKEDKENSPFVKASTGHYMLASSAKVDQPAIQEAKEETEHQSILQAAGLYWHEAKVKWKSNPKLLGRASTSGAQTVDFSLQTGVYLLHDRSRVIYVGRTVNQSIGQRLFDHTKDRLNGRWDRFSWFGLKKVTEDGKLAINVLQNNEADIISLLEAVLIEALEPPQNRKRGDDLNSIEYLQLEDPAIKKERTEALFKQLIERNN